MKRKPEAGHLHRKGSQPRLLDLPTDILINIISRLEIRDAIRTSVLSSHWRYLWRDHANLALDLYTLRSARDEGKLMDVPGFLAKVDAVLEQHSGVGVNFLYVRYPFLRNTHADHIDKWVKFAVESRTKELTLILSYVETPVNRARAYDFPCHLFSHGSYVRCLRLLSVSLNLRPPDNIDGFLNLRELTMVDVGITEEHVEYLLSRCSLLEFLKIVGCKTLTNLRASSMNRLKHLAVHKCTFLERIEMNNCGQLTTLEYTGPVVPLEFAAVSRLTNVSIDLLTFDIILDYMTTGFPSTLPHLETFSLRCMEQKRANFPARPIKFMYLRHLRLEAFICDWKTTDVLDYAYLLDAAPFLEKLEVHMWMRSYHLPYVTENYGELRSLTTLDSHKHTHLKSVYFTGFFGYKDQVELALHILHSSAVLQSMKIDPEVKIMPVESDEIYEALHYVDGRMAATEFVCKADHNNVVQVVGASSVPNPRINGDSIN